MEKIRVMMICLGNICRSPLAEAVLRQKITDRGAQDRMEVDSCGTAAYHIGEDADPRTRRVASAHGIPMDHVAKQFVPQFFQDYDHLVVMDHQNRKDVMRLWNGPGEPTIHFLASFDEHSASDEVFDPWYGDEAGFEENYQLIDRCCEGLMRYLEA